ncbi:NERD domain-containing protein [Salicibibacter kimchii]|uniref:NERD domain-containing protein n=1 Tax=Salicibibacter kimchii TaxID=2099786 RepID=A0A345BWT6_9BACI|nr:NERD domain-containing protein [Salicibibacter kimchii]AXF55417.1 NERD domain-containing protein [Salicibibacter kimchii]
MILKPREVPTELKTLRLLRPRMTLPDEQHYLNLEKGFTGEQQLDTWLENLTTDCFVINDLLLQQNRNFFQIDKMLIFQETIYLLDSKYSKGDFFIDDDKWKTISGIEIQNPQLQIKRSETLLRKLLQQHRMNFPIESTLVFTHSEFYLYNAPPKLPAVFPNQIHRFLEKLNRLDSKMTYKHNKLAEKLLALHFHKNPHTQFPDYDYHELKKGVLCVSCRSFMTDNGVNWVCAKCGYDEDNKTAIMRSIEEYKFLFPNRKITTNNIYDWCGMKSSKKKVNKLLTNRFIRMGHANASYYID